MTMTVLATLLLLAVTAAPLAAQQPTPAAAPDTGAEKTYFEFQVQYPARIITYAAPTYPPALRDAKTEGEVLVQFVVGTDSLAIMRTFKVLRSDHGEFTEAVRAALPGYRFAPALIEGKRVRQLVQMPFVFSLAK